VRAFAYSAKTIERGNAQGGREISIRSAAGRRLGELLTQFVPDLLRFRK
jgi:hypothetical protein